MIRLKRAIVINFHFPFDGKKDEGCPTWLCLISRFWLLGEGRKRDREGEAPVIITFIKMSHLIYSERREKCGEFHETLVSCFVVFLGFYSLATLTAMRGKVETQNENSPSWIQKWIVAMIQSSQWSQGAGIDIGMSLMSLWIKQERRRLKALIYFCNRRTVENSVQALKFSKLREFPSRKTLIESERTTPTGQLKLPGHHQNAEKFFK
jgi:hypothetical protein